MSESDVLAAIEELERDEIDDLVDLQMRQTRSGYDYNVNQLKCIHCQEDAHSVPITERMQQMRRLFRSTISYYEDEPRASDEVVAQLDAYRYDQDDSPIVCPGSDFIGAPKPPAWQLEQARRAVERERTITEYLSGDPSYERLRGEVSSGFYVGPQETLGCFYAGLPLPDPEEDASEWVTVSFGPFARPTMRSLQSNIEGIAEGFRQFGEQMRSALVPVADALTTTASSMMDLWSFTLPDELEFPRSPFVFRPGEWVISAADVERAGVDMLDAFEHRRIRGSSPSSAILDEVRRYTPTDEGADMIPDESFADPPPTNRRQRRGYREPREPMWTPRLGRGGNRR